MQSNAHSRQALHHCAASSALLFVLSKNRGSVPTAQALQAHQLGLSLLERNLLVRVRKYFLLSKQGFHKS